MLDLFTFFLVPLLNPNVNSLQFSKVNIQTQLYHPCQVALSEKQQVKGFSLLLIDFFASLNTQLPDAWLDNLLPPD